MKEENKYSEKHSIYSIFEVKEMHYNTTNIDLSED